MFISDFIHIGRPFQQISMLLVDQDGAWLVVARRSASQQRFTMTAGEPQQHDSVVLVPRHWSPTAFERLVPDLDADIELLSLGVDHCRLSLSGRYRLPLAQLGAGIDRLGMHRVAESAVRRFLSDIARALESE